MPGDAADSTTHSGTAHHDSGDGGDGGWSRESFVEEIGLVWEAAGSSRMDGRIIAYLLITDVPYVSSAELARALRVSAGSVSLATRRLVEAGFIRRHAVPGERSHYFRVEDDVWGSFLAGERRYLDRQEYLAEQAITLLGPEEEAPRRRLSNMRDYMRWVRSSHGELLAQWRTYRAQTADRAGGQTTDRAGGQTTDRTAEEAAGLVTDRAMDRAADRRTTEEAADRTTDRSTEEAAGLVTDRSANGAVAAATAVDPLDDDDEATRNRLSATVSPALAQRLVPDTLWATAEPLLPSRSGSERPALTAVVYVLTSGCGWGQLPAQYGISHSTAHRRFTSWSKADFWQRWLDAVTQAPDDSDALSWCSVIAKAAADRQPGGGN
ncbi:transposase [Streptomyces sp. GESEQ-35]|uniref:transposase n=1 Tax=Streptomyces sp. GESEQ-35 TaxID=2812657 RepID=UPI001B33C118|nr:transposase [Streptomyces sp. GESEQ-35]